MLREESIIEVQQVFNDSFVWGFVVRTKIIVAVLAVRPVHFSLHLLMKFRDGLIINSLGGFMFNRLLGMGRRLIVASFIVATFALFASADNQTNYLSPAEDQSNSGDAQVNAALIAQCGANCIAPDNGGGTVDLPAPCEYLAPGDAMYIINGLPPLTQIECEPQICCYFNILRTPGGSLGGEIQTFDGQLSLMMTGNGALTGYTRSIFLQVQAETHTAPHTPGLSVQSFDADLRTLFGQLPPGDPDFDLLRITAGTAFGMPSPGHTTLTSMGGGNWAVESFFDITYRIDFVGAPGSALAGMSGSNTGTIRMSQGGIRWRPGDSHKMHFPQLPDESGWDVKATQPMVLGDDWRCSETGWVKDIHFWGSWRNGVQGQIVGFNFKIFSDVPSGPTIPYSHPGSLLWERDVSTFNCAVIHPLTPEGWYEPNTGFFAHPDHAEYIQYDVLLSSADWFMQTFGTIYWLCIEAKIQDTVTTRWGWKSSQQHFNDDAVWAVSVGSGVPCVVPDNGGGTVDLPASCPYGSNQTMDIINGLPAGTTIESAPRLGNFSGVSASPGGSLGGEVQQGNALLELNMNGTGALLGYNRFIILPTSFQTHTAPRTPGTSPQSFAADMFTLQGQMIGDPDFDLLRITAGTGFGMPSPGHTTLVNAGGGNWAVESFFDITYRIDFVGAPGSPLAGMSGSTTATIRIHQGGSVPFSWVDLFEPPAFIQSLDLAFVITGSCCVGIRGDVNNDGADANILDLTFLVDRIFRGGPQAVCLDEADVNSDGAPSNILDLTFLVDRIFRGGPAPGGC